MSDELGVAILELDGDLLPLDARLKEAKTRVSLAVAEMQAELDSLHMNLDLGRISAARIATSESAGTIGNTTPSTGGGGATPSFWGVKGGDRPGSVDNPLVMVQAAGQYYPLGSRAAQVGEDGVNAAHEGTATLATAEDINALRQQLAQMAGISERLAPAARLAQHGREGGMPWPVGVTNTRTSGMSELETATALREAADSLARLRGQMTSAERQRIVAGASSVSTGSRSSVTNIYDYTTAPGGSGGGGSGGGPPVAYGAPFPGDSGGSSSGGGPGPVLYGGGSGRARTMWLPLRGMVTMPDSSASALSLANLLRGNGGNGGIFGLPAIGSAGSLAGFGLEHFLLTGLGLLGSAGSALGGASLLGAGSLSQMTVGAGADMLASATTLANVKSVYSAYDNLGTAVETYGKNSTQAKAAQQQLNAALADLPAKAGPAETSVAKAAAALTDFYQTRSQGAQIQSAHLMSQFLGLGHAIVPFLANTAQRNLSITNQGLAPLFSWLKGPEGMQIFGTLENSFAKDLPNALHATDMGLEDFLRLMQAVAPYTGRLVDSLDRFFSGKAQESTSQYQQEVQKLVGDFREWEALLHALGGDLSLMFHADQGTANSIVRSLTEMLNKLHAWEESATGQSQLTNIFTVHKQEILALLNLLPELVHAYGSFYMLAAPPLVNAVTDIAKAVAGLASAIEKIPGGGPLLGLVFVLSKLGALGPAIRLLGGALGLVATSERDVGAGEAVLGAGGAAGVLERAAGGAGAIETGAGAGAAGLLSRGILGRIGATGLGTAVSGAVESGGATLASSAAIGGSDALAGIVAGGASALAPAMGVIVPVAIAALGAYGGYKLFQTIFSSAKPTTSYNAGQLETLLQAHGTGALSLLANPAAGRMANGQQSPLAGLPGGSGTETLAQIAGTKQAQQTLVQFMSTMRSGSTVAQMGPDQLQGMIREGQALEQLFPKLSQTIGTFVHKAQGDLAPLQNVMQTMAVRWANAANYGLKGLEDVFTSNMRLISSTVGLQSAQGKRMMAQNIEQMVAAVTASMDKGRTSVTSGTRAMVNALNEGVADGAITWQQKWTDMFTTVEDLFQAHKIDAQSYASQTAEVLASGAERAREAAKAAYQGMVQDLKTQLQQGQVTQAQYAQQLATARQAMLSEEQTGLINWLAQLRSALASAGKLTTSELASIDSAMGAALSKLSAGQVAAYNMRSRLTTTHAQGGLVQIGQPGEAGQDTVPVNMVVGRGEQVAVFNRHQAPIMNAALAAYGIPGGLPGLFGAVSTPNYMAGGGVLDELGHLVSPKAWKVGGRSDMSVIRQALAAIRGLIGTNGSGGSAGSTMNQLAFLTSLWGIQDPNYGQSASSYIVTTDPVTGLSVTPYIDQTAVALTSREYHQALQDLGLVIGSHSTGSARTLGGDLGKARSYVGATLPAITAAIDRRRRKVEEIRGKIRANLRKIAALRQKIATLQKNITTERGKQKPNYGAISGWQNQISSIQVQISSIEAENRKLGGSMTTVGTGGEIGTLQSEISGLRNSHSNLAGYGASVFAADSAGSAYGQDYLQMMQLRQQLAGLSPTQLNAALNAANASNSSSSSSQSQQTDQQAATQATDALFTSQQQYKVLADALSGGLTFGGSFAKGGIVPGALGEPTMILAHGGEVVTPVGGSPGGLVHETHVHIQKGTGLERLIDTRVEHVTRQQAKRAMRPRAGQRAGLLTINRLGGNVIAKRKGGG